MAGVPQANASRQSARCERTPYQSNGQRRAGRSAWGPVKADKESQDVAEVQEQEESNGKEADVQAAPAAQAAQAGPSPQERVLMETQSPIETRCAEQATKNSTPTQTIQKEKTHPVRLTTETIAKAARNTENTDTEAAATTTERETETIYPKVAEEGETKVEQIIAAGKARRRANLDERVKLEQTVYENFSPTRERPLGKPFSEGDTIKEALAERGAPTGRGTHKSAPKEESSTESTKQASEDSPFLGDEESRRARYEARMRAMEERLRNHEKAWQPLSQDTEKAAAGEPGLEKSYAHETQLPKVSRVGASRDAAGSTGSPGTFWGHQRRTSPLRDRCMHAARAAQACTAAAMGARPSSPSSPFNPEPYHTGPMGTGRHESPTRGRRYSSRGMHSNWHSEQEDAQSKAAHQESDSHPGRQQHWSERIREQSRFNSRKHNGSNAADNKEAPSPVPGAKRRMNTKGCPQYRPVQEEEAELWNKFDSTMPSVVTMRDIPFPKDRKFMWRHNLTADEKKASFKQLAMRWHPDKFIQRLGDRLAPAERDAVMVQVNETFNSVQSAFKGSSLLMK